MVCLACCSAKSTWVLLLFARAHTDQRTTTCSFHHSCTMITPRMHRVLHLTKPLRTFATSGRQASDTPFQRAGPMPLPKEDQHEFERLVREKQSAFPCALELTPKTNYHSPQKQKMAKCKIYIQMHAAHQQSSLRVPQTLKQARWAGQRRILLSGNQNGHSAAAL